MTVLEAFLFLDAYISWFDLLEQWVYCHGKSDGEPVKVNHGPGHHSACRLSLETPETFIGILYTI